MFFRPVQIRLDRLLTPSLALALACSAGAEDEGGSAVPPFLGALGTNPGGEQPNLGPGAGSGGPSGDQGQPGVGDLPNTGPSPADQEGGPQSPPLSGNGQQVDNGQQSSAPDDTPSSEPEQPPAAPPSNEMVPPEQPPANEPPANEPPANEPPANEPPVNEPPVTPPPVALPGNLFFADGFEGGRQPDWEESINGGGSFSIDTSQGANGTGSSLRVDGGGFHTMLQYRLPELVRTNDEFYGRVHVRVDQQLGNGHFIWVEAGTAVGQFLQGNDQFEVRIGYNLGVMDVNRFPTDQEIRDPASTLSPGTWHCLQFFMDNDPEEVRIWLDGEETALSTTDFTAQRPGSVDNNQAPQDDWMPPFEAIRFGWELNGSTIWYDEVALGTQFIDCQ